MKKSILILSFISGISSANAQWMPGGMQMTFTAKDHYIPVMANNSSGNFYVSWTAIDTVGHIMLNGFDMNGNRLSGFPVDGIEISNPGGDYWRSAITMSEDGNPIVTWFGETTVGTGSDRRHVFVQKFDNAGNPLWNAGLPIRVSKDSMMHHMNSVIISDKEKGCYVAWRQMDLSFSPSSYDLYVQRIDSTGNIHTGWNSNPTAIANQTSVQEDYQNLALSPDKSTLYMCYTTGGINLTLKMQGINSADGSIKSGWTPTTGLTISPGPNIFPNAGRQPAIFTNGNNEAIVLWVEFRGAGEIYLQKVNSAGVILLAPSTGKVLYNLVGDDIVYFDSFRDIDGKIIFAWRVPSGANDFILMNKTDDSGNLQWGSNFTTVSGKSAYPKVRSDAANGSFLFNKEISATDQLFGARIDSVGNIFSGWTLPGVAFGTINNYDAFNPQRDFQIFSLNGSAVVVWTKKGGDNLYDLYGCNLTGNGSGCLLTSMQEAEVENEITIFPNPSTGRFKVAGFKSQVLRVEIYSMLGEKIYSTQINFPEIQIDLDKEPNGIYFLQIKTEQGFARKKIVISK